jgi:hypothetical protein
MHITGEITVGNLIEAGSFLIAAIGLFLNWWQLRIAGIRKRAEFIVGLFNQYVMEEQAANVLYKIEYDEFRYDGRFHGSAEERQLDRLLTYFEKIAALYEMHIIRREDLELVRYDFIRVHRNPQVQKYFQTLDEMAGELEVQGGGYERYRRVAALLDTDR